jgi:hypothetical protein
MKEAVLQCLATWAWVTEFSEWDIGKENPGAIRRGISVFGLDVSD